MMREHLDFYCETCGSRNVTRDARAQWNAFGQAWEMSTVFDEAYCPDCEATTKLGCVTAVVGTKAAP